MYTTAPVEEYRQSYAAMTDEQLLQLANDLNDLNENAKTALEAELSSRNFDQDKATEFAQNIDNTRSLSDVGVEKTDDFPALARRLPRVWVGFALSFVVSGMDLYAVTPDSVLTRISSVIALFLLLYWLYCVHQFHEIPMRSEGWKHSTSSSGAVAWHFVPVFNVFWLFVWPVELRMFIKWRSAKVKFSGLLIGAMMLFSLFMAYYYGRGLGLPILFGSGMMVWWAMKRALLASDELSSEPAPFVPPNPISAPRRAESPTITVTEPITVSPTAQEPPRTNPKQSEAEIAIVQRPETTLVSRAPVTDHRRKTAIWSLISVALILMAGAFAWFVWPTIYRYDYVQTGETRLPIRTNRFSGDVEIMGVATGWKKIRREMILRDEEALRPLSLHSIEFTDYGWIKANVHNGTKYELRSINVELSIGNPSRPTAIRQYRLRRICLPGETCEFASEYTDSQPESPWSCKIVQATVKEDE